MDQKCKCIAATGAIILPNVGGWLGAYVVKDNLSPWYKGLRKPEWTPPDWVFGPVWTTLYSGIGYASYLVWKNGGGFNGPARIPLMCYGAHLAINWAWTPIFFGYHKLKAAFYEILGLDVAAATTAYLFYKVDKRAGLIFIPYLMWLSMATALTYRCQADNPEGGATITEI